MKVDLLDVSKGRRGTALPRTRLAFQTGAVTLARAETEQRPTVLGLIASGRMRPDTGRVLLDGEADASGIRSRVALVDAPGVSDPASDVTVAGVVAEELMFAGIAAHPASVDRTLAQFGVAHLARRAIGTVPPTARLRLLCELAVLRDGVEGIVLTAPDRHGGNPLDWWAIVREFSARGYAVLAIAGDAAAAAIAADAMLDRLGREGAGGDIDEEAGA
ncbi:hypothetical protein [Agromyces sp. SYSU T00194]|uniref:hypothetical protein n=1 Tax=Agromyces chitinivorans TaxID=3158560 RepID=UPI00339863C1